MEAVGKNGGTYITFSDRFSYSGMTGAFDPIIKAGVKDIDGTTGPAVVDTLAKAGGDPNKPAGPAPDGAYDVEYTMQTHDSPTTDQDHRNEHEANVPYQQCANRKIALANPQGPDNRHTESDLLRQQ
jgi:hypothetical protein